MTHTEHVQNTFRTVAIDLDELEAVTRKAKGVHPKDYWYLPHSFREFYLIAGNTAAQREDANYIAAASPTTILSLIARVRAAEADDDETYEIGKRDGYESAIQELDLATGGDGEFYGSTFPGETVDVSVMQQRIIARFAALEAKLEKAREALTYCAKDGIDRVMQIDRAYTTLKEITS